MKHLLANVSTAALLASCATHEQQPPKEIKWSPTNNPNGMVSPAPYLPAPGSLEGDHYERVAEEIRKYNERLKAAQSSPQADAQGGGKAETVAAKKQQR